GLIVPQLANPALEQLSDAGLLTVGAARLALTTDAFVVRPIRFPGGSAGELAGVPVIAGDTKVVERGKCDCLYVTTTGIGVMAEGVQLSPERVRPGDKVLVSGTIGDHGIAILLAR